MNIKEGQLAYALEEVLKDPVLRRRFEIALELVEEDDIHTFSAIDIHRFAMIKATLDTLYASLYEMTAEQKKAALESPKSVYDQIRMYEAMMTELLKNCRLEEVPKERPTKASDIMSQFDDFDLEGDVGDSTISIKKKKREKEEDVVDVD